MTIWVDADACPVPIKEILFRAARRTETHLVLIANHALSVPSSPYIQTVQVMQGFDAADDEIERRVAEGDLVVTADIPLADAVISKACKVITPRGEALTAGNIKSRLNMRDFLETMRSSGVQTGGPAPLSSSDKQAFAAKLDRYLAHR